MVFDVVRAVVPRIAVVDIMYTFLIWALGLKLLMVLINS